MFEERSETYCKTALKKAKHYNGLLDPESTVGRAKIAEYVVYSVLKDCIKPDSFRSSYDLKSDSLGIIDVKECRLRIHGNHFHWVFELQKEGKFIPDQYICIGFNYEGDNIEYVWIIPSKSTLIKPTLRINKTHLEMLEFEKYEANYIEYNRKFKTLNIKDLSEFCNLKIEPKINYPYATSIPDQLKATLLACRHTYMSIGENSSNVIYSHYLEECDNLAIEKLSKRQLLNYLDELENLGFIECEVKSLGRYGRSKYLTSVLDDREVYQILFF